MVYRNSYLLNLFERYAKETKQNYQVGKTPNKPHFGIMAGAAVHKIEFMGTSSNKIYLQNFPTKTTPTFGLTFRKYLNGHRKIASVNGTLFYTQFRHNETLISPNTTFALYDQIWNFTLDVQHLNIKIAYMYEVKSNNERPFFSVGILHGISMHREQDARYTYGSVFSWVPFYIKASTGIAIGMGIRFKKMEVGFDYQMYNYRMGYTGSLSKGSTALLGLTYWFN